MQEFLNDAISLRQALLADAALQEQFEHAASAMVESLQNGGKILIAGNGGSAADAQHFAAELIGRFERDRGAYAAIALTTDSSILTAVANDFSFETIFSRQVEGLGQPGDVFVGITTSGNSPNIINALRTATSKGLKTIGFLGKKGGEALSVVDIPLVVPSDRTALIQEIHLMFIHLLAERIEQKLG